MFNEGPLDFTAIDFETANGRYESICQIGLVRFENGEIVKEIDCLVKPPENSYHWGNSRVHGLGSKDTKNAPTFDKLWHLMEPYIFRKRIVAHNSQFDAMCLRTVLKYYNLDIPPFDTVCTVKIYKKNLKKLCEEHDIELMHHNALSDARACAALYMKYLKKQNI
ncbi:MAG TPA: 3'-5' exonuclease [Chitinophagaceae bacterium]|nr:3'-5' exonuclease [Chitinophagaceae bacterium]